MPSQTKFQYRVGLRKAKHVSQRMISIHGQPAPSWVLAPDLARLANAAFRACVNPHAKPDLIRVYYYKGEYQGKCWITHRLIVVRRDAGLKTLAHEIAHLRVRNHCPSHEALTEVLHVWLKEHRRDLS
jgi:hypothetical protein